MAMTNKQIADLERFLEGDGVMTENGPAFGPHNHSITYKSLYTKWLLGEEIPHHLSVYFTQ